jgi:Flp pilus assembly pilin Flp
MTQMKQLTRRIKRGLAALHRDEGGADMVEYILVMAAIALPIVAIVIWFRDDIADWAKGLWEEAKEDSEWEG